MNNQMKQVLIKIAKKLNQEKIVWAVGASLMLHHFGLYEGPNDIDIFVEIKDANKAKKIFDEFGKPKEIKPHRVYTSNYFYKYDIDNISIDVIAGYQINHTDGVYRYNFDKTAIGKVSKIEETEIPYCSLEDWQVMYRLMPGGEQKAKLIENYLK